MTSCNCKEEISVLQHLLSLEQMKCKIYKQIVEQKINVTIDDSITISKKRVKLICTEEEEILNSMQTLMEDVPTPQDCIQEHNRMQEDNAMQEDDGMPLKDCLQEINALFLTLPEAHHYTQIINNIKKLRLSLQNIITVEQYIETIKIQTERLKNFLKADKKWSDKKISGMLEKFLTPLEFFLSQTKGYEKQMYEVDELTKFQSCVLKGCLYHTEKLQPFQSSVLFNHFTTCSMALFDITTLSKFFFNNKYNTNNLVYIAAKADFGFYFLHHINEGKKFWKMDCRLEQLTTDLISVVRMYCIHLFRKIYFDCFNDNSFRENYEKQFLVLELQGQQLLENLFNGCNFIRLNIILRDVVSEFATYMPSPASDVFDYHNDDMEQKSRFENNEHLNEEDLTDIATFLFDNISTSDATEFYESHKIKLPLILLK